jgi:hypothetical protein
MPRLTPPSYLRVALVASATALFVACSDEQGVTPDPIEQTPSSLSLERIGGFAGGGPAAAEITAYDSASKRLFVVNGALGTVDVLDLSTPASPSRVGSITVTALGAAANSVASARGIVAVAIEGTVKTDAGRVALYRASDLTLLGSATVGALPDMVVFTPDGRYVLSANEGEPNNDYTIDPEGSISIIDVQNPASPTVRTAGFGAYNGQEASLRASGVRIYGPGANAARDLEPEYITVSADGATAWVTLQENNALAVVNVTSAAVTDIRPLGYKNHNTAGNGLDASDRDSPTGTGFVNIRNWPVFGMYQPDAIASYTVNGQTYLVTANEGDARDWTGVPGLREEARVSTLTLNPAVFTDAVCGGPCNATARLGRLTVTNQLGLNPTTNQYDALYVLGARSFSIWSATGSLVWDSGDQFEQRTTSLPNVNFNASNSGNALDDRSDNKGPEPEGVVVAKFGTKTYAFIGLERVGGVMVYDITTPTAPTFVTYFNPRTADTGDLGPEGLTFIPARQSGNGKPLLIVGNEVSGTTAIYQINLTY